MGEVVLVVEKPTARPGVVRFETNRPLTGTGHRSYSSASDWRSAEDPADELARRLFERGGIDHVHVYGNVLTVELSRGVSSEGLLELIRELFSHYGTDLDGPADQAAAAGEGDDSPDEQSSADSEADAGDGAALEQSAEDGPAPVA